MPEPLSENLIEKRKLSAPHFKLNGEVLGLWVMHNNRASALLRVNLPIFRQVATNALGFQKPEKFFLIAHLGARWIAKAVATAPIFLREQFLQARTVIVANAKLGANTFVPQFGQRFGALHAHAVQVQIFRVFVALKKLLGAVAYFYAHSDAVKGNNIALARISGSEKIADAQTLARGLPWESEALQFAIRIGWVVHHQVVGLASAREKPVNNRGS